MSETSQAEAGSLVELWVLMLSKKRIVCGHLSMETLLFQFYFSASFFSFAVCLSVHGSASECSFLSDWVQVWLPAPVSHDLWQCHYEHTWMSQEDFYRGGRETSMFPGQGQKRKCLTLGLSQILNPSPNWKIITLFFFLIVLAQNENLILTFVSWFHSLTER